MIVTEHRPPLKRIDTAPKARPPEVSEEGECVRALREAVEAAEHDRVWRLLRQSAEGCNPGEAR